MVIPVFEFVTAEKTTVYIQVYFDQYTYNLTSSLIYNLIPSSIYSVFDRSLQKVNVNPST